jgi:hypothetical protein
VRYVLSCAHCGADITSTDYVRNNDIAAVEAHLRGEHPEKLHAVHPDFAEVLGHARVKTAH